MAEWKRKKKKKLKETFFFFSVFVMKRFCGKWKGKGEFEISEIYKKLTNEV